MRRGDTFKFTTEALNSPSVWGIPQNYIRRWDKHNRLVIVDIVDGDIIFSADGMFWGMHPQYIKIYHKLEARTV